MKQQIITLHGKDYPVAFDLQTIINYEEITGGQSIFGDKFTTIKSRIVLIMAAVLSADPDTDLTLDTVLGEKDWASAQSIINAYVTIDKMASKFFKIPETEKKANEAEAQAECDKQEDGAKN